MKKFLIALLFIVTIALAACQNKTTQAKDETAPVISGVADLNAEAGQTINLLSGVTAVDETDGDITSSIKITIMPTLTVTDGKVTPAESGTYEIKFSATDKAGNEGTAFCSLNVTPALADKVLYKEYQFGGAGECPLSVWFFSEENPEAQAIGTGRIDKGVYRIEATATDNEAWHIKYHGSIETVDGADYKVTYTFTSNVAGKVKFGGDQEFDITEGLNTVTGTFTGNGDNKYTELQLGMLNPFVIEIQSVSVEQTIGQDVWSNVTNKDLDFSKEGTSSSLFDNNSEGTLVAEKDSVTLNITKGSDENGCWQTRLIVKPGMDLTAGKYQIKFDVLVEKDIDSFEVQINNGDVEKGIDCMYGQNATAGEKKTITWTGTISSDKDNLTLVFQLGQANVQGQSNVVTVSNLQVLKAQTEDEALDTTAREVNNDFWSDSEGSSAINEDKTVTMTVNKGTTNPNVWELKQYIWTNAALEAGRTYVVTIDVTSNVALPEYEALLRYKAGGESNIDGAWGQTNEASVTNHIEFEFIAKESFENVGMVFQLGKLQDAAEVTFSNFTITAKGGLKEVETTTYVFTPEGFGTYNNPDAGCAGSLYVSGGNLVYEMNSIGLTDWYNKMYVEKITLEEDKIYTFEFTAKASTAISCAWFLNVFGKWDARLSETCDFTTEWVTFSFTTSSVFAAEMDFELLWQFGSEENSKLKDVTIEFQSLKVYAQDAQ